MLRLKPVDDRDELDEDFIGRGNRIHKALEDLRTARRRRDDGTLSIDDFVTQTLMSASLSDGAEANPGLAEIEDRRFEQTLLRYDGQARDYAATPQGAARPADPLRGRLRRRARGGRARRAS